MAIEPFLTPAELASRWRVDESTITRGIRKGKIPAIKILSQYRIKEATIEKIEAMGGTQ